jgi:hypothetical protein
MFIHVHPTKNVSIGIDPYPNGELRWELYGELSMVSFEKPEG